MTQHVQTIQGSRETIRGVVVPEQWDEKFHVTQVHIACKGEREIRVANLDHFPILLSLSQTEAVFTGTVTRQGATESIIVESYTTLDEK